MSHAWKKLQKLQKLRVTKSSDVVRVDSCSSIDMVNLELLDLSGNTHMESLPTLSSARSLKMLVLDGCSGLEHVALAMERAPPQLESFSFDGYGPAENWTHSIHLPQRELRLKSPIAPIQIVQHIYLYNCPRLVFVLPISSFTLLNLETLQIAYCSSLRHVFPLDDKYPPAISSGVTFRNLKQIKLYHLHNLEQICEPRLTAPALQTIGIRDCWGLRRLPAVARQSPKTVVDCEKDWWNNLEWDGLDAGHDPSLFETRHSAYYKKTLPRVSYLRLTAPTLQTIDIRDCWGLRRLPAVARQDPKPVVDCEKDWWNKLEWDGLDAGHDPSLFEMRHSAYYKKTLPRVSYLR
uniref:Uncharacterized protein n=1 Tax=Avena sativa TaxID=4498 RepID=A0ACD6AF05_AVESA